MSRVFYCTREEVMDAFDTREASHRSAQIDSAIASASDDIDGWLNRHKHGLAPRTATRYFDFPDRSYTEAWRLWLDENELVSVTSLTAGTVALTAGQYFLEPVNSGPPYTYIEVNLGTTAAFGSAASFQRAIAVSGVWGINNDQKPAGTLAGAVNSAVTALNVSDSSLVGVGSVLTVDSEQMLVTGRSALTTGVNLGTALTAQKNNVTIAGISLGFSVGEILLIDSERMRIVENNGTDLTVVRAWDGSVLAAHNIGATLYAYRALTVERGALGTVGASHSNGATVTKWDVPPLVRDLCRGEAITRLEQEFSAYGARVYSDEAERDSSGTEVVAGRGLTDLRKSCARRYKRKFRKRAV
jgi:hypothetical protein